MRFLNTGLASQTRAHTCELFENIVCYYHVACITWAASYQVTLVKFARSIHQKEYLWFLHHSS